MMRNGSKTGLSVRWHLRCIVCFCISQASLEREFRQGIACLKALVVSTKQKTLSFNQVDYKETGYLCIRSSKNS